MKDRVLQTMEGVITFVLTSLELCSASVSLDILVLHSYLQSALVSHERFLTRIIFCMLVMQMGMHTVYIDYKQ